MLDEIGNGVSGAYNTVSGGVNGIFDGAAKWGTPIGIAAAGIGFFASGGLLGVAVACGVGGAIAGGVCGMVVEGTKGAVKGAHDSAAAVREDDEINGQEVASSGWIEPEVGLNKELPNGKEESQGWFKG